MRESRTSFPPSPVPPSLVPRPFSPPAPLLPPRSRPRRLRVSPSALFVRLSFSSPRRFVSSLLLPSLRPSSLPSFPLFFSPSLFSSFRRSASRPYSSPFLFLSFFPSLLLSPSPLFPLFPFSFSFFFPLSFSFSLSLLFPSSFLFFSSSLFSSSALPVSLLFSPSSYSPSALN